MTHSPHIAVIGAGILGMFTAANLIERGARVTVIDASSIASGSSGRSLGMIGTQFTDPFHLMLRRHSLRQYRALQARGLDFNRIGYLRLARTDAQMALIEETASLRAQAGFRSLVISADALTQLVPHMDSRDFAGGMFGPDDGFIDPHHACTILAEDLRAAGGSLRQYCRVQGLVRRPGGGYRLETDKEAVDCDGVVNAGGAWAPSVAAVLGQTLHVRPERHEALTILLDEPLPYTMPMVMDLLNGEGSGLNYRHATRGELVTEIHKVDTTIPEYPDRYNELCDESTKTHLAEMLLERLPDLPGARLGRGWAGLYPETADHRPLVGPIDPAEPGLVTAAGAGGYGIQLAPAIGQVAADWAVHGSPVSAPGTEALAPTPERNVAKLSETV
jgi:sarcosine oxidase subunit beta